MSTATTVSEARLLQDRGADVIIAQGIEAGGHRGTFEHGIEGPEIGLMALVPAVLKAVDVPVIAAGGIVDGQGIAAVLALGAAAAQMGTAFVVCPESAAPDVYRQAFADALTLGTEIMRLFSGRPARALRNSYLTEIRLSEAMIPDFPLPLSKTGPLGRGLAAAGSNECLAMWAGQAAHLVRPMPAADLVETLAKELRACGRV